MHLPGPRDPVRPPPRSQAPRGQGPPTLPDLKRDPSGPTSLALACRVREPAGQGVRACLGGAGGLFS